MQVSSSNSTSDEQAACEQCPGCHAVFTASSLGKHDYLGSSSGCWAAFGEILAYQNTQFRRANRLVVDTYAVQHPGVNERRTRQSVNVHLIALHLALVEGQSDQYISKFIAYAIEQFEDFLWLPPLVDPKWLTVGDVVSVKTPAEHGVLVRAWAKSVWEACEPYYEVVQWMIDELRNEKQEKIED